jgi:hypothetical protein
MPKLSRAIRDETNRRREVQERYNRGLQGRMKHMVWSSGCRSWYLSADGANHSLYPGFAAEYALRTRRFDPSDYETVRHPDGGSG